MALAIWVSFNSPRRRKMFWTTITAPSTMMPKPIAPRLNRLAGMPTKVSPRKVASSDSGITTATIAAARRFCKKTNRNITSSAPSVRLANTVCSIFLISQLRS